MTIKGVLDRDESLAANLGAKLTAHRLLKGMEGAFEAPIKATRTNNCPLGSDPPNWLDIVKFSKSNPSEFVLSSTAGNGRLCQFHLGGYQVKIEEEDWRLIVSGAMDRFIPMFMNPFHEDEVAEFATVEIVESQLQRVIKKADIVARRGRYLNYHMLGRKAALSRRTAASQNTNPGFQPVNQTPHGPPNPCYDLKADLLEQFISPANDTARSAPPPAPTVQSIGATQAAASQPIMRRVSIGFCYDSPRQASIKDSLAMHRPLVTARVEKLSRGDAIIPPCDRCRRLKMPCIKHQTACQGCTKKHARCVWDQMTEDELASIMDGRPAAEQAHPPKLSRCVSSAKSNRTAAEHASAPGRRLTTPSRPEPAACLKTGDHVSLERQDDNPERNTVGAGDGGLATSRQPVVTDHSLLGHIASLATAEAAARATAGPSTSLAG